MKVKIWDDNYIIKSDAYCYKLIKINKSTEDDEDGVVVGYYGDIENLFVSLVDMEKRANKCTTLNGYIKHIEDINKKLEANLEQIKALIGTRASMKRIMSVMPESLPKEINEVGEESVDKKSKKKSK